MPTEIPPPPYQLSGIEFAQIGVLFDPVAIAPLIPPGIRLASPPAGAFYCYSAPAGWGISPYTACLVFVNVEGFDSADGSQGRALLAAFYSDRAEIALRQYLRLPVSPGGAELTTEHGTLTAYGIRDGKAVIRLVLEEPTSPPEEIRSGVHYYLGQAANGAIRIMPVAFCLHFGAAKPLSVEILSDDPDLRRLAPAALMWGGHHRNASITLGAPAQLPGEHAQLIDEEARVGVLSILSELGRPAVFMDRQGKVVFVNHAAEAILGDGLRIVGRALVSDNREDQKALDALVHKVINRKGTGRLEPLAVRRRQGGTPIIVRCFGVGSGPSIGAVAVMSLPDRKSGVPSLMALKLLGLTSAEARIAALVGSGLSPRDAGIRVGNTERTVRFTLGRVYEKLDISRQSELAMIVAEFAETPRDEAAASSEDGR